MISAGFILVVGFCSVSRSSQNSSFYQDVEKTVILHPTPQFPRVKPLESPVCRSLYTAFPCNSYSTYRVQRLKTKFSNVIVILCV